MLNSLNKISIAFVTLGCPRNLVNSQRLADLLAQQGFCITDFKKGVNVVILNTCAFIEDAKKESIDTILEFTELKKYKKIDLLIVWGCLIERYRDEIKEQIKEIDRVFSLKEQTALCEYLFQHYGRQTTKIMKKDPVPLTPSHYAYIKIAEGCNNKCSYCILPTLHGPFVSRPFRDIVDEAKYLLLEKGVSEINLIAQDTLAYGMDIDGKKKIVELINAITKIKKGVWLRILYANPFYIDRAFIELVQYNESVCKYLDIPLQHISNAVLKKMYRPITERAIYALIDSLRKKIPDIALRTTFLVGFPGETDRDFKKLLSFIKYMQFDRVGAFVYSREEGTKAYLFRQQIPKIVKQRRYNALMHLQKKISFAHNQAMLGKKIRILIDELNKKDRIALGRTQKDAPEIDGIVYAKGCQKSLPGDFVTIKITDATEYDLMGEKIDGPS